MKTKLIFSLLFIFVCKLSAHGEDQPGPNGGFIKMPGAFHTELVLEKSEGIKIFLLDMEWKNPTTKNSSVELKHRRGEQVSSIVCRANRDHFSCSGKKLSDLKVGTLEVLAKRESQVGNLVRYELPLRLEGTKKKSHEGHH